MVAQFTGDEGCPVDARTILTYSQSTNPNSPYYADQTRLYSGKGWDTIKYTDAQLAADPNLRTYTVRAP
jgi:acyl-homoserine-lactone acylase